METLRHLVVLIHLVGFAAALRRLGRRSGERPPRVTRLMNWGLAIAGLAGLILAAPWGIEYDLNYVKLGVKLVILVIIGALLGIGAGRQRKNGSVPPAIFWSIGVLTLGNAAIAVLWR